ncbi:hypothetical protein [Clostridium argentinense]|uniref:hypothetical protein n=1 Tax=Clostridium argentinense TaxID=29341 RepID=UPI001FA730F7|nr:hypothetical protein [Clostridium argentinense]
MSEADANYVRETYIPCNYWYAVSVEQDIHVDFDHVLEKINGMLNVCYLDQAEKSLW